MSKKDAADRAGRALMDRGLTLAVAESLTGGLLSAAFAEGDDAATWFRGGIVAYSAEVKRRVLGVPEVPVVSEECARAMAAGALQVLGADVAVAVTGVGGPDSQDGLPPGTVWLATATPDRLEARLVHASGDPQAVCSCAVDAGLSAILDRVLVPAGQVGLPHAESRRD